MPELDWDHLAEVLDKATDNIDIEVTPEKWTDPGDPEVLGGPLPSHSYLDGVAKMTVDEDIKPYFEQDKQMFKTLVSEIMFPAVKEEYPEAVDSEDSALDDRVVRLFFIVERVNE